MRLALALLTVIVAAPATADGLRELSRPLFFGTHDFRAFVPEGKVPLRRNERGFTFAMVDTNRNGVWDPHEIVAAFGPAARDVVMSFDADGDGHVTVLELRAYGDAGTGRPDGRLWERVGH